MNLISLSMLVDCLTDIVPDLLNPLTKKHIRNSFWHMPGKGKEVQRPAQGFYMGGEHGQ
jgi:hypothetical protein